MRILFSINGFHPDSVITPITQTQEMQSFSSGTLETSSAVKDVLGSDMPEVSNDNNWDVAGHDGHPGPAGSCPVNTAMQIDKQGDLIGHEQHDPDDMVCVIKETPAMAIECNERESHEALEINAGFAECEDCVHFDFLNSVISQSCQIGAAKPYRRYPTGKLPEIVAICSKKQSMQPTDGVLGGRAYES